MITTASLDRQIFDVTEEKRRRERDAALNSAHLLSPLSSHHRDGATSHHKEYVSRHAVQRVTFIEKDKTQRTGADLHWTVVWQEGEMAKESRAKRTH
jgi:hypothetical protein